MFVFNTHTHTQTHAHTSACVYTHADMFYMIPAGSSLSCDVCLGAEGTDKMDQTIPVSSPAAQHHVRRLPETCTCSIYEQKTKGQ